jgi:hypothetical protein
MRDAPEKMIVGGIDRLFFPSFVLLFFFSRHMNSQAIVEDVVSFLCPSVFSRRMTPRIHRRVRSTSVRPSFLRKSVRTHIIMESRS